MAFPTGLKKEHQYGLDNGVLRSQRARGRFLLAGLCVVRVGGNRQEREKASGQIGSCGVRTMACAATTTSRLRGKGANRIINRIREDELCQHAVVLV